MSSITSNKIGTKPLSPYFQALARKPRICPECLNHKLKLNSLELTWDGAVWKCDGCGWFQLELAPDSAKMGPRTKEEEQRPNVIKVGFGRR